MTTMAEDEDATNGNTTALVEILSPPQVELISPPGMKLRSGRKKRRRSSAVGGDSTENVSDRKRTKMGKEADDEDDNGDYDEMEGSESEEREEEEMEGSESEEGDEDMEEESQNGGKEGMDAVNGDEPVESKRVLPIAKLRMPSQHTPGTRAKAQAGKKSTGIATATGTTNSLEDTRRLLFNAPPMNAIEQKSATAGTKLTEQQQRTSKTSYAGQVQPPQVEKDGEPNKTVPLARTDVWIGLLFIVYVILSFATGSSVLQQSERTLGLYQSALGIQPYGVPIELEVNMTVPEMIVPDSSPPILEEEEEEEELSKYISLGMDSTNNIFSDFEHEIELIREQITREQDLIEIYRKAVERARSSLQSVVDAIPQVGELAISKNIIAAKKTLEELKEISKASLIQFFEKEIPLWNVPVLSCPKLEYISSSSSESPNDAIATAEHLIDTKEEIVKMVNLNVREIKADAQKFVQHFVKQSVSKALPEFDISEFEIEQDDDDDGDDEYADDDGEDMMEMLGITKKQLQDLIQERLEVERADRTGQIDYASIQSGATIIQSGDHATSPSLVDNIPLFNRLMVAWRLRFYGHGPEAALTPTFPKNALGQCWSFEDNAQSKEKNWRNSHSENSENGKFGTLTIRLAKPLHVTSVVIEHPPAELSNQVQSAIKDFRVTGYEDERGSGTSIALGEFAYGIDEMRSLQEFKVKTASRDGSENPKLHSITLAIDSNHQFPYTCLYRFRVHGTP